MIILLIANNTFTHRITLQCNIVVCSTILSLGEIFEITQWLSLIAKTSFLSTSDHYVNLSSEIIQNSRSLSPRHKEKSEYAELFVRNAVTDFVVYGHQKTKDDTYYDYRWRR